MLRHILPSTLAPLAVQATYNCGTAILTEAFLSFLGSGIPPETPRSEEHTSELQSPMRISYAVFCLKKKIITRQLLTHFIELRHSQKTICNIQYKMPVKH